MLFGSALHSNFIILLIVADVSSKFYRREKIFLTRNYSGHVDKSETDRTCNISYLLL